MKKNIILILIFIILLTACTNIEYKKSFNKIIAEIENENYDTSLDLSIKLLKKKMNNDELKKVLELKAISEFALKDYKSASNTISMIATDKKLNDKLKLSLALSLIREKIELDRAYQLILSIKSKPDLYDEVLDEFLNIAVLDFSSDNIINFDILELKKIYEKEYKNNANIKNINRMGIFAYIDGDYTLAKEYFSLAYSKFDREDLSEENTNLIRAVLFNKAAACMHLLEKEEALALLEEYINLYGMDEKVEHEYTFIKSRVR